MLLLPLASHIGRFAVVLVVAMAGAQCVAAAGERALQVTHFGANTLQLGASYQLHSNAKKRLPHLQARSLASDDVDGDGFADLVSGYATDGGGVITLHRGNREAWAPSTPESLALVAAGGFPAGFESVSTDLAVPVAPDFMVSGDFNGDGRADIVFAQRGDRNVYFLAGQRTGFSAPMQIKLDGGVDALASGRIDSRDGFPKLVAAVSGAQGASLLTFTQGMNSPATPRALAAPVEALAVGKLTADSTGDIVMLSAGRVHIVHGTDGVAASSSTGPMETLSATFSVRSFALGEFIWDRTGATKIALLADDGAIHVAARADIDTRPFTVDEVRAKRLEQQSGAGAASKRSKAAASAWQFVRVATSRVGLSGAGTGVAPKLLRARFSNLAADDILVIDEMKATVDILTDDSSGRKRYSVSARVSANQAPVAVLSLQTSAFVLPSLVVLGQGAAAPSVAPPVPLAVFTVTKTADTNDGVCNADCSLREAISAANATAGSHTINVPAGTYTLTIANAGGINEDNNAT